MPRNRFALLILGLALSLGLRSTQATTAWPRTDLLVTGDPANRINVTFVGDGYTATQQGQFNTEVDAALNRCLPSARQRPTKIHASMRYSIEGGGKRVRPILCLAACEASGGSIAKAMPIACALELIHTYSLIHDDLPCMDDDDLRRGRPTNHKIFGEGMAVLAGDALLTLAFEILAQNTTGIPAALTLRIIHLLANASNSHNLIGGQVEDLLGEGRKISRSDLRFIHRHKTAALIQASVEAGGLAAQAPPSKMIALQDYGWNIGLAFQIADDILDVIGDEKKMGKRLRKDAGMRKATYPGIMGMEKSRKTLKRLTQSALRNLRPFGAQADPLRQMARFLASREN